MRAAEDGQLAAEGHLKEERARAVEVQAEVAKLREQLASKVAGAGAGAGGAVDDELGKVQAELHASRDRVLQLEDALKRGAGGGAAAGGAHGGAAPPPPQAYAQVEMAQDSVRAMVEMMRKSSRDLP